MNLLLILNILCSGLQIILPYSYLLNFSKSLCLSSSTMQLAMAFLNDRYGSTLDGAEIKTCDNLTVVQLFNNTLLNSAASYPFSQPHRGVVKCLQFLVSASFLTYYM